MDGLSKELLNAIGERARDPARRTYTSGVASSSELPQPANEAVFAELEDQLKWSIPDALRQIYRIADGGFGPGSGLLSMGELLHIHQERCSAPFGPLDQPWPAHLLVLCDPHDVPLCLDLESGKVIAWEADRIEDESSQSDWENSFVIEAENLESWLANWLSSETFEDMRDRLAREMELRVEARGVSPVTGFPVQFDDPAEQAEGEIAFLAHAPDLRADFDLPEDGWEAEIRRRHGLH